LTWIQNVQAHVLERDGSVSAVLHMPPDDAPVAGEATIINLAFSSSDRSFTVVNYQIALDVLREGRTVQSVTMERLDQSDTDTTATVNLPQAGAYTLSVKGTPKTGGTGFRMSYDVRAGDRSGTDAAGQSATGKAGFDFWAISLGAWAILLIIATSIIRRGGRYQG